MIFYFDSSALSVLNELESKRSMSWEPVVTLLPQLFVPADVHPGTLEPVVFPSADIFVAVVTDILRALKDLTCEDPLVRCLSLAFSQLANDASQLWPNALTTAAVIYQLYIHRANYQLLDHHTDASAGGMVATLHSPSYILDKMHHVNAIAKVLYDARGDSTFYNHCDCIVQFTTRMLSMIRVHQACVSSLKDRVAWG